MVNQDQVLSLFRSLLVVAGGAAMSSGYVSGDQLNLIGGLVAAVVPAIWGFMGRADSAKINSAANTPGVEKVVLTSQLAANDHPNPKVVGPNDAILEARK